MVTRYWRNPTYWCTRRTRLIAASPSGVILKRPPPAGLSGLALLTPSSLSPSSSAAAQNSDKTKNLTATTTAATGSTSDFVRFNALGILGVTAAVSQLQLTAATAEHREREARRAALGLTASANGAKRFVMPGRLLRSIDAQALGWRGPLGSLS